MTKGSRQFTPPCCPIVFLLANLETELEFLYEKHFQYAQILGIFMGLVFVPFSFMVPEPLPDA